MKYRICAGLLLGTAALLALAAGCTQGPSPRGDKKPSRDNNPAKGETQPGENPSADKTGHPMSVSNDLVIPNCHLSYVNKQDVPSPRDGVLLYVATEARPEDMKQLADYRVITLQEPYAYVEVADGEQINPDDVITRDVGPDDKKVSKKFRRWRDGDTTDAAKITIIKRPRKLRLLREGDEVKKGQLLALVDPSLEVDEVAIKKAKADAAIADQQASVKTRDEAKERLATMKKLAQQGSKFVSDEDLRGAQLTYDRYFFEEISKVAGIKLADKEFSQALTTLRLHEIRSQTDGVIKTIYRSTGEAVKNQEPVMQILDHDRLRIEARVEMQYLPMLRNAGQVIIEPALPHSFRRVLNGHLGEIRGVAVSEDRKVVSASDDRTVRVWDRISGASKVLQHPAAVLAVACPAKGEVCLSGAADGLLRLWDLDRTAEPKLTFKKAHQGPVNCVAFSPNGKLCASGGEDRSVCVWDVGTGELKQQLKTDGHKAGVTSVTFANDSELISVGRTDGLLLVWNVGNGSSSPTARLENRTNDVPVLGYNKATREVLFDEGKELRVLALPSGQLDGLVSNVGQASSFTTFALFSPDGNLILTASEGRLQLWRTPSGNQRASELRQLIWPGLAANCAAFAPGNAGNPSDEFIVTGMRDRQVVIWNLPSKEDQAPLTGTLSLVDPSLDGSSRELRVWADIENKDHKLLIGQPATLVVRPQDK
jgi:WD40 repeat protein